ncbi:MAG: DUF4252 domain-containing protein [Bacteroidales bacterium]|nr:DUF4252 domain-containing protein [Bacteroidales bacterium]
MKRIIVVTLMLLIAMVASAQEGKNIYNKYSGNKGVSAVYISPAMFRMIGNLPDLQVETANGESMNLAPLIKTFQGFYMLDISDSYLVSNFRRDVENMIGNGRYELLMEVKDEEDTVNMYTVGNEKIIESFVFVASDGESVQFICIDGDMSRDEVEKLILAAAK